LEFFSDMEMNTVRTLSVNSTVQKLSREFLGNEFRMFFSKNVYSQKMENWSCQSDL
jgi:hypothetical protein